MLSTASEMKKKENVLIVQVLHSLAAEFNYFHPFNIALMINI